jgi:hypothetical protein
MPLRIALFSFFAIVQTTAARSNDPLREPLAAIRALNAASVSNDRATEAWQKIAKADVDKLGEVLSGMDGANAIARNWLRAAVAAIIERAHAAGSPLPVKTLEDFLRDTHHDAQARRLAYELLLEKDPTVPGRFLPDMLDDPSLDLRHDAVQRALDLAGKRLEAGQKSEALVLYQQAYASAREKDQIDKSASGLRKLDQKIDLAEHLGMVLDWKLIGPFPNAEQKGIDAVYPPEHQIDPGAQYEGKNGKVHWTEYHSSTDYGLVDLNQGVGKHTEAVAYAATEFDSARAQEVEVRIGCFTAFKLWVNGELVLVRGDAWTGMSLDHYQVRVRLHAGKNTFLLKSAQDVPPPQVPQIWQFQLRVCDLNGAAILSRKRQKT